MVLAPVDKDTKVGWSIEGPSSLDLPSLVGVNMGCRE